MCLDFQEITIVLLVFKSCDCVVDFYSLLRFHYFEYTSFYESLILLVVSLRPSLLVKRLHCISEVSGWLIGVNSGVQTF